MARTQVYIARNIAPTRTGQTHLNCRAGKDLLAEGVAEAGADALFAYAELWGMLLKQIECEMAQSREVLRPIVALDPTVVRAESYVQHPMASVLNRPMRAYGAGNGLSLCRQRRDEIRRSRPICPSMRRSLSTMSVLEGFGDRQCGEATGTRSPADQRKRDAVLFRGEADQRVDRQSRAADEAKAEVGRKRPRAEQLASWASLVCAASSRWPSTRSTAISLPKRARSLLSASSRSSPAPWTSLRSRSLRSSPERRTSPTARCDATEKLLQVSSGWTIS